MTERALSQQVTELVRKLFWRDKSGRAGQDAPRVPSAHPRTAGDVPPSESPGPIVASKLQLIGLGKVRTILGDRWPKLAGRVRGIAQTIIEKNLLPGDVYEAHGDDGFMVLFPKLCPEDARFKSAAICRQIEQHLIGCNLTDVSACSFEVFTIDPGHAPSSNDENGSHVHSASQATVLTSERLCNDADSPSQPAKAVVHQRDAAMTLAPDTSVRDAAWSPLPPRGSAQRSAAGDEKANSIPAKLEPAVLHYELANNRWVYRPVWDFQRSMLLTFALIPFRHNTTGIARDAVPTGSADEEFLSKLDNAALSKGVSDLETLSNSGRRLPILAQLHYATIVNAQRRALFLEKVKSIPQEGRKLISFEIVECPHDGLTLGLTNFIAAIRGCGVRVAMRVHADWRDFRGPERCGIKIATMDASHSPLSEAEQITAFEKFAARAGNAKLESGVWGLGTRSMVIAAASAGIRHLAGNAIAQEVPNLSHALRFSPVDLYLHHQ